MTLCSNPRHPRGRWHRKGETPNRYDVKGRIFATVRERIYGCTCPPQSGNAFVTRRDAPRPSYPRLPVNAGLKLRSSDTIIV